MAEQNDNRFCFINGTLVVTPNWRGNPQYLYVATPSGLRVKISPASTTLIDYNALTGAAPEWTITSENMYLQSIEANASAYLYLKLVADGTTGILAVSPERREDWLTKDGNDLYLYIGVLSKIDNGERTVTLVNGTLGSDEANSQAGDAYYARKDRNDDISSLWTFKPSTTRRRGIVSDDYKSEEDYENLNGTGFAVVYNLDGSGIVEADSLLVRDIANIHHVVVKKKPISNQNGETEEEANETEYIPGLLDVEGDANIDGTAKADTVNGRIVNAETANAETLNVTETANLKGTTILGKDGKEEEAERVVMKTPDFIDSLMNGKGLGATNKGRMQLQNLEVRGALTVMDLIVNQIRGMAGEFYFSDTGTIESVLQLNEKEHTYRLFLRKETPTDLITFWEGDILFSIANNLRSHKPTDAAYYVHPSWMKVLAVKQSEAKDEEDEETGFYVDVQLYNEETAQYSLIVGVSNFAPEAGFNLVRRGNYAALANTTDNNMAERARTWHLSNTDGMIAFLDYMYEPVVSDENYQLTVGRFPDIKVLREWFASMLNTTPKEQVGIYTKFLFAEQFIQLNWMGRVSTQQNFRGDWTLEQAESEDEPYRVDKIVEEGAVVETIWRTDTVQHLGCIWACATDKTKKEPYWGTTDWTFISGPRNWEMAADATIMSSIRSTEGLKLKIEMQILFNGFNVTDKVVAQGGSPIVWTRYTGEDQIAADNAFNSEVIHSRCTDAFRTTIILLHGKDNTDLGVYFTSTKTCQLSAECTVLNGNGEDVTIKNSIPVS